MCVCVCLSAHGGAYTSPSVDRMTDTCENITFPQLLLRTVRNNETQVGMLHFNHMNYLSRATVTCDVQRNELTLR